MNQETDFCVLQVRHHEMADFAPVNKIMAKLGMRAHRTSVGTSIETFANLLGGERDPRLEASA